ncbi:MAG: terminase family protein [Cyclobacteriaceae bacterium]|nr:terminase family protein [Cyclobacteriaceae bacterium]
MPLYSKEQVDRLARARLSASGLDFEQFSKDPTFLTKFEIVWDKICDQVQYNRLQDTVPYPHQMQVFNPPFRAITGIFSGNRSGKSFSASLWTAISLTGRYPAWWQDFKYERGIICMVGGEAAEQICGSLQLELFGTTDRRQKKEIGTGLIPRECIVLDSIEGGSVPKMIKSCRIKHESGTQSTLTFFTYTQDRAAVQGGGIDALIIDEQPEEEILSEALRGLGITPSRKPMRCLMAFTPLRGLTPTVQKLQTGSDDMKLVRYTWDDVPEQMLPQESRRVLMEQWPEYELDCRVRGLPMAGQGRVFAVRLRGFVTYDPNKVDIKDHWLRIVGIDPGRHPDPTALTWVAWDRENDVMYIYDHHEAHNQTPIEYVPFILARGKDIPIAWPRDAKRRGYTEVESLADELRYKYQLKMLPEPFTNPDQKTIGIDYGIQYMLTKMRQGKLKVNQNLEALLIEMENYHVERLSSGKLEFRGRDHGIDACLLEGTLVATQRGQIPIEQVTTNDQVLTRAGYQQVLFSGCTGIDQPLLEIAYKNHRITCTPNHLIYTQRGFVRADALRYDDVLCLQKELFTKDILIGAIQSLKVGQIAFITALVGQGVAIYIATFGRIITALFQRTMTFIIKMATRTTMPLKTCNASIETTICENIQQNTTKKIKKKLSDTWNPFVLLQKLGMQALLEKPNIEKLARWPGSVSQKLQKCVSNAASLMKYMKQWRPLENFVAPFANKNGAAFIVSYSTKNYVSFVNSHLNIMPIENSAKKPVRHPVCSSYKSFKPNRVYDLTVKNHPEFFANGILVHNCRYACLSIERFGQSKLTQEQLNPLEYERLRRQVDSYWENSY